MGAEFIYLFIFEISFPYVYSVLFLIVCVLFNGYNIVTAFSPFLLSRTPIYLLHAPLNLWPVFFSISVIVSMCTCINMYFLRSFVSLMVQCLNIYSIFPKKNFKCNHFYSDNLSSRTALIKLQYSIH